MGWPYDVDLVLSADDKLLRRQAIDFYACLAHYSALAPVAALLLARLARRLVRSAAAARAPPRRYDEVPSSPLAKAHRRHDPLASLPALRWWLRDDVCLGPLRLARRDDLMLGLAWSLWLLLLCVVGTGKDYLHLTKRFGAIAVSQLPIQFLLSLKTLNPFAFALRSSHEEINRYHRVLGRIIHALLILHAILYNYFFFVKAIWLKRFFAPIVFCGVVAFAVLNALSMTSFAQVRQLSYRLFFIVHVAAAFSIPVLIFFHAPSARIYLVEALVALVLDMAVRKATTVTAPSTVQLIPGTNLVKITASLPLRRLTSLKSKPGSHVYLSVPPASRLDAQPALFDFLFNPFTVASVDEQQGTMSLVARVRDGPMTLLLSRLAASTPAPPAEARKIPLAIEGPYGAMAKRFDDLLDWGAARILLVAGGVGATFALPVYRALRQELPSTKVQLVWAVRSAADATWAVSAASSAGGADDRGMLDDDNVQIFLTGDMDLADEPAATPARAGAVEMTALSRASASATARSRRRPELDKIVDAAFRHASEESVAVLVCGPADMASELRQRLRPWAARGRRVWWHSESFGW